EGRGAPPVSMNRRDALMTMGAGFGMTAFAGLLGAGNISPNNTPLNNAAPIGPHFTPKAKRVIFLFLNGGPSHVDTFDPKPALTRYDGKPAPNARGPVLAAGHTVQTGNVMKSPWAFRKYGQSGLEVSDLFPKLGGMADHLCVVRSMYSDIPNHP